MHLTWKYYLKVTGTWGHICCVTIEIMGRGKKYACFPWTVVSGRPLLRWRRGGGVRSWVIWNKYIHCISWKCIWVRNESCISPLSKKRFHAPTVGRKKIPARDAPWVDTMNFISQQFIKRFCILYLYRETEILSIRIFLSKIAFSLHLQHQWSGTAKPWVLPILWVFQSLC